MNQEVALFLAGQAILLVVAGLGFFWGISAKIGALRADVANYAQMRREALAAHIALDLRVDGISRTVERHDTILGLHCRLIENARRS